MQYENINAEEVERGTIEQQARQLEERAIYAEYETDRFAAVGETNPAYAAQYANMEEQSKMARKEADAFVKEAKARKILDDDAITQLRRDVLTRIIQSVEQQHASSNLVRDIRKNAGLPVADRDNTIVELEAAWDVAARKIKALGKPKAEKRTNADQK